MQSYELCAVFGGSQTPAEIDGQSGKIDALLAAAQAEIKLAHNLGRRKLAYQIKNQSHGEYRLWLFLSEKKNIPALNEKLRLSSAIIRHLLIVLSRDEMDKRIQKIKDIKAGKPRETFEDRETEPAPPAAASELAVPEPIRPKEKEKLSLDDLDKKLDEILESDKI